jgi:hypothetical protein
MQANDSFRLVVRRGPQPNQTYDLNKDIVTLGRDITNDITINDPEVSRHHMRLTRGAGGFTLEDLGSTNGTFVNGQRLTGARPLRGGDMIGLGETVTLAYEALSAAPAMGVPGAPMDDMPMTAPNPAVRPPVAPPQPYAPGAGASAPGYGAPQQPPAPQQPYGGGYSPAPSYGGAPAAPPAGQDYGYDPYEVREEGQRNNTRWILIGCTGLALFCCCASVAGLFFVDSACLWENIPLVYDAIQAFGFTAVCP